MVSLGRVECQLFVKYLYLFYIGNFRFLDLFMTYVFFCSKFLTNIQII